MKNIINEASKILRRVYLDLVEKSLQETDENQPYTNKEDLELLEEIKEIRERRTKNRRFLG